LLSGKTQRINPPAGGPASPARRAQPQVGDEAISMNARSATQSGTQNPDHKIMGFFYYSLIIGNKMRTVGEIIHGRRQELKKDIKKIAAILKIREDYLLALEKDEYQVISGGMPIVQGIVRRYAQFLGLDPGKLAAIIRRDFVVPKISEAASKKAERQSAFFWTPRYTFLAVIIILVCFLSFFLFKNFFNLISAPQIQISAPREGEEILEKQVMIKGKVKRADVVLINGQSVTVLENGAFEGLFSCDKGENLFLFEAVSPRGKKTQVERRFTCR